MGTSFSRQRDRLQYFIPTHNQTLSTPSHTRRDVQHSPLTAFVHTRKDHPFQNIHTHTHSSPLTDTTHAHQNRPASLIAIKRT
mmetsp:Transcript_4325/g.11400  ORF Transcript_4325/g.11400 Transcript_4325/m.11400 type:complete len:83 (-) Transcript_4325:739-987(-)